MKCEEVREHLVMGAIDPTERLPHAVVAEIEIHLRVCPECRVWRAAEAHFDTALAAVVDEPPPTAFRDRVMEKVRDLDPPRRAAVSRAPRVAWWRQPAYIVQGVAAAAAAVVFFTPTGTVLLAALLGLASQITGSVDRLASVASKPEGVAESLAARSSGAFDAVVMLGVVALVVGIGWVARRKRKLWCLLPLVFLPDVVQAAPVSADVAWTSLKETSDVIRVLALLVLGFVTLSGTAALGAVWRGAFKSAAEKFDWVTANRSGGGLLFVGLCNTVFGTVVVSVLARLGPLRLVALVLLVALLGVTVVGVASRMRIVGRGIAGKFQGGDAVETLIGGLILAAVFLIPVIGQIVWLGVLVQAFGAGLIGLVRWRRIGTDEDLVKPVEFRG